MEARPAFVPFAFRELQGGVVCKPTTKLALLARVWNSLVDDARAEGREAKKEADFEKRANDDPELKATEMWEWSRLHRKNINKKKQSQAVFDLQQRAANALDQLEEKAKRAFQDLVRQNYDKQNDTLDWSKLEAESAKFESLVHDHIQDELQSNRAFKDPQDD